MRTPLLVAIAIGDAYGRPFEFAPEDFRNACNDLSYYTYEDKNNFSIDGIKPEFEGALGVYTDDTQMSLAIAEHMLFGDDISYPKYMRIFMQTYMRDIRGGYSKRITSLLDCEDFSTITVSDKFDELQQRPSNGAVMRCLPIGMYSDVKDVIKAAFIQAATTHPSIECVNAATYLALYFHYHYHGLHHPCGVKAYISQYLNPSVVDEITYSYNSGPVSTNVYQTVSCCMKIMDDCSTETEILKMAVDIGGDVDSLAAICMGLATVTNIEEDIPSNLVYNLENGEYGYDYLLRISDALYEKFPPNNQE